MVVIKNRLHLHLGRLFQHFVAIQVVLIDGDIAIECELEDVCEQIELLALRLHGIVETRVSLLVEVYLTIDVTTPHHILGHVERHRILKTHTSRHSLSVGLLSLLLFLLCSRLYAAVLRLSLRYINEQ